MRISDWSSDVCSSDLARSVSAYVYSAAGPGESTTDLAWDGQGQIHELGELIAESQRFDRDPELLIADVDIGRIRLERERMGTFNDAAAAAGHPETRFRRIGFEHRPDFADVGLRRRSGEHPSELQSLMRISY